MQLVRLKKRLAEIKTILLSNIEIDESIKLDGDEGERVMKYVTEAIEAAEKIGFGHQSIVEVLNRI